MASQAFPLAAEIVGQGYPLLCLHGHPGSAQCMRVFTNHLSDRFLTVAPDLRGYGKSQTKQPFEMEDHLADLEALVDRLQLDRFMILGWSLGGILALELALRRPEQVTGLVLVATAASPRGDHPPISWQDNLYTGIAGIINKMNPGWDWNIETFGKRSLFRHLIQQHTPNTYQHLADEAVSAYLQTSQAANQALWNAQVQLRYNRLSDLARIACPALMLAGECDRHITAQSSQETAEHMADCQFKLYANTAHLFPWEISKQVLADIDLWIEQKFEQMAATPA